MSSLDAPWLPRVHSGRHFDIQGFKRVARILKRATGLPHCLVLEKLALVCGYVNYAAAHLAGVRRGYSEPFTTPERFHMRVYRHFDAAALSEFVQDDVEDWFDLIFCHRLDDLS
ncbi:hypothetical protein AACH06_25790 [Ideonella sp. DXS29W]|uniref:Uncharacterized protein n=1 Tax=Ideonella lacteola TaxID=2984193 RepID=A0ABU9BW99_9BURK